ncbi:MAG: entericidin EcnA/B family protein [Pseudoprimorskyibacter sp.]|jgi:predicted small secreted protein|nr:entericidin EcnA/B family protein [Pseudoprimorskyibacter sp.]
MRFFPVILIASLLAIGACSTIEGVGEDLSGAARRVGDMF